MNEKIYMFGIGIDNLTMKEVLLSIEGLIEAKTPSFVVTPNVDHIVQLQKDTLFKKIYNSADLVLADGMPVIWVSKLLGKPLKEKVSGADLTPHLFKLAEERNYKVFILGAGEGVGETLISKVRKDAQSSFPLLSYSPPFGFENDTVENHKIIAMINDFEPDLLLVSLGAPKGEKWIYRNKEQLKVSVSIQVGAAIDFMAGSKKRAPIWMQRSGLEWFYRFLQEPKRMFKRYFIQDSKFAFIVVSELFKKQK